MACDVDEMFSRAILILHQRVANAGLVGQVSRGKGKKSRLSVLPFDRFNKSFRWHRENCIARTRRDHFVRIAGKDCKNLRAVCGEKMRTARANGKFPLARGAAVPKIFYNFRAESLHRLPSSNPPGYRPFYRRSPGNRGAA